MRDEPAQKAKIDQLLQTGIEAARSDHPDRARDLLMHVVELEQENTTAWMWLSSVVDDLQDKEICLENVLTLDPGNTAARRGLAWVRGEIAKTVPPEKEIKDQGIVPVPPPLFDEPAPAAPEPPPVEADPRPKEPWDYPVDLFLCPYCAAPTQAQDQKCPRCGQKLWVNLRRRTEPSWWLMNAITFQIFAIIFYVTVPLVLLTYAAYKLENSFDPFTLLPIYLGQESNVAPQTAEAAFKMIPSWIVWPFLALALYSLAMLIGTYFRWKPVFYLLLCGAGVRMALSIAAIAVGKYYALVCGGAGALSAALTFFIIFQLEDDFMDDRERIYFAIGRKIKSGVALISQGRSYARQNMWALAVLYLRAGVARMPEQIAGYTSLISAYLHLGRYDLAESTLGQARRLEPHHPQIAELETLLHQQQAENDHP